MPAWYSYSIKLRVGILWFKVLYEDKLECTVWDTAGGLCRAEESKFNEVFIHITWALFWKGVMEAVED